MSQLATLRSWVGTRPARPRSISDHAVVIGSGKGGTGTSTAAALLAFGAAASGRATLLVDAALPGGSHATLLGLPPADSGTLQPLWRDVTRELTLVELPAAATTPAERRSLLRRTAGRYNDYELVVVDAGSAVDTINTSVSTGTGRLLAVSTADRLSVVATYALLKYAHERFPTVAASVLMSRCEPADATEAFARIVAATREFLHTEPALAGSLPDDPAVRAAAEAGRPPFAIDGPARHAAALLADLLLAGGPGGRVMAPAS